MNIKLKKIKILEPPVKITAGFRVINGDIPVEQIIGMAGSKVLIADGPVTFDAGNAIQEEL